MPMSRHPPPCRRDRGWVRPLATSPWEASSSIMSEARPLCQDRRAGVLDYRLATGSRIEVWTFIEQAAQVVTLTTGQTIPTPLLPDVSISVEDLLS